MNRREIVAQNLADCVARLDSVLQPWGFTFVLNSCQCSHTGPFASGRYVREMTRRGLSCRDTIDSIYYEHSFVTTNPSSHEIECFTIGHQGLMRGVGRFDVCHLIESGDTPDAILARDGGDRVAALLHDWQAFAAPVLSQPCDAFFKIVRRGFRAYSIE